MPDDLQVAVEAVAVALDRLRAAPDAVAVLAALDQAGAALGHLEPDLSTQALRQVLNEIERCRRAARVESRRLQEACRAAAVALQIDPRRV